MTIDFGRTASDYARHRAGFPDSFFARIAARGIARPGQRLLDLGTGTGTIARGFRRLGLTVTALDVARPLIEEAKRLDAHERLDITYVIASAEETGLPSASFDIVTAGQCWHWFDRPRAAAEAARLLARFGWLVIAHFDWIPLAGNVAEATEQLIERHNPAWTLGAGNGIHAAWLADVAQAGFKDIETFSYDTAPLYSHEAWRGRVRASAGIAASLPRERVDAFDRDLALLLADRFPEDPLPVHHRVWAMMARAPA